MFRSKERESLLERWWRRRFGFAKESFARESLSRSGFEITFEAAGRCLIGYRYIRAELDRKVLARRYDVPLQVRRNAAAKIIG
jgi:hypothetical protein